MSNSPLTIEQITRAGLEVFEEIITKSYTEIVIQNNLKEIERLMRDNRIPSNDVLRVAVNDDGTFNIYDFGFTGVSKRKLENIPQEDVPQCVMEAVSMLRIADEGSLVPELGFKVNDHLYYIIDKIRRTSDE